MCASSLLIRYGIHFYIQRFDKSCEEIMYFNLYLVQIVDTLAITLYLIWIFLNPCNITNVNTRNPFTHYNKYFLKRTWNKMMMLKMGFFHSFIFQDQQTRKRVFLESKNDLDFIFNLVAFVMFQIYLPMHVIC